MTKFEQYLVIIHLLAYEDGTECSETSAYKIQTPGNYPEENIQNTWSCMYSYVLLMMGGGTAWNM